MKAKDLREMNKASLINQVSELTHDLAEYKGTVMSGKEKNHAKLHFLRRDLARAKTILNQTK